MISKELLSEVLGKKVDMIYTEDYLGHSFKPFIRPLYGSFVDEVNIYELAHKCKEWALTKHNTYLSSWTESSQGVCEASTTNEDKDFFAETEPEAIFKACEWILKDK